MKVLTPSSKKTVSYGSSDSFHKAWAERSGGGSASRGGFSHGRAKEGSGLPFTRYSDAKAGRGMADTGKGTMGRARTGRIASEDGVETSTGIWKLILVSVLIGVAGVGYIHHGYQMQRQLDLVQGLELELERTRRIHQERRLELDRATGPKDIYARAQELGFVSPGPADRIIHLD